MNYERGYFKALLDVKNLLENSKRAVSSQRLNNFDTAIKVIEYCIKNKDEFMKLGGDLEFYFHVEKIQKGKKTINQLEILSPDNSKVEQHKLSVLKLRQDPTKVQCLMYWWNTWKTMYSQDTALEYFKEKFGKIKLRGEAKDYYEKVLKENTPKKWW